MTTIFLYKGDAYHNICQNNHNMMFFFLSFSPSVRRETGLQRYIVFKVHSSIKFNNYHTVHICVP